MGQNDDKTVGRCNGLVTTRLLNIATMITYVHEDGRECNRPGPVDLAVGTLVESEWRMEYGLCEHTILAVHDTATEPEEKSLTVADILGARPSVSDDAPVSKDVIERAKVPPRIKSNPSTAPARTTDAPVENRFEFDLDEEELRELNFIRGVVDEPISTGHPVSPFSNEFNPGRAPQPGVTVVKRKPGKPVSVFDLK